MIEPKGRKFFRNKSAIDDIPGRSPLAWLLAAFRGAIGSDFFRKAAETLATRVVLIGIGLTTTVLVARILGPEGRGLYAVAITIGAIGVQFGNLGLHASNTYYVARDRALLPTLVGNTLSISFVFGGFGAACVWGIFALWPGVAPAQGLLLALALAWIPFGLAYMLLQNLLLGIQEVRAYNTIELLTKLLAVALIGLVIVVGRVTPTAVFAAGLAALIISFTWALYRLYPYLNAFPRPSFLLFKDNIRYGVKAYLAAFFAFLVLRVDILLVKQILGAEQAGYYSIAATMADMVYLVPAVVGTLLFPKLSAAASTREKWRFSRKVIVLVGALMLILVAAASLLAWPVTYLLYGPSFLASVPAFVWLMPGIFFLGVETVAVQFLNSVGFPKIVVVIWVLVFVLNVVLNLWAIPAYGIAGASLVSSLSYFLVFALVMLVTRAVVRTHETIAAPQQLG
jgi:O-antigen/teichoic acid export membrane protein